MEHKLIEKYGFKFCIRKGTSDEKTIDEVIGKKNYEKKYFKIEKDEHWIDLGGNIGAFTIFAISKGAKVTAYEPDPNNCEMFEKNLKLNKMKAQVINKAVVSNNNGQSFLSIHKAGQFWRNSLIRNVGDLTIKVPTINFETLTGFDGCKMDIEGSEMKILEKTNNFINKLVFEWSFDADVNIDRYRNVVEKMKTNYTTVKARQLNEKYKTWQANWFPPCLNAFCFNSQ